MFKTIVADPPWKYSEKIATGIGCVDHRGPEHRYNCMTLDEIKNLPISTVLEPNSHLYLWTTNTFMEEAHQVARNWGFVVRSILTWVKPHIGLGYHFRNCTEHVVFGVRGKLPTMRKNCKTWFNFPKPKLHSQKPEEFFNLVSSMSPGPHLEIFARKERLNWTCIGNEIGDKKDINQSLLTL